MKENSGHLLPKKHRIEIKKPLILPRKDLIICPFCGNMEEFYEIMENTTFYIHYYQTDTGVLEPIEESVEVLGVVKFYCGVCHSDLTLLKKSSEK